MGAVLGRSSSCPRSTGTQAGKSGRQVEVGCTTTVPEGGRRSWLTCALQVPGYPPKGGFLLDHEMLELLKRPRYSREKMSRAPELELNPLSTILNKLVMLQTEVAPHDSVGKGGLEGDVRTQDCF